MENKQLRIFYGRLVGLREVLSNEDTPNTRDQIGVTIRLVINELIQLGVEHLDDLLEINAIQSASGHDYQPVAEMRLAVEQAVAILEYGYGLKDQIIEIGSLYNTIRDPQLRDRCADLLSSDSNFDRVVNQATLTLEDRIRRKVGGSDLTGTKQVNHFIKADLATSLIVFAQNTDEQKGYADIARGIFLALRNGTHHQISDEFTREDAFIICGFIDRLLRRLDAAAFRKDL